MKQSVNLIPVTNKEFGRKMVFYVGICLYISLTLII